jgi:hypothetical protein
MHSAGNFFNVKAGDAYNNYFALKCYFFLYSGRFLGNFVLGIFAEAYQENKI